MKFKYLSLGLICITLCCRAQQNHSKQIDGQLLQSAYKHHSLIELNAFFESWRNHTPTISASDLNQLNDTVKQAYRVFTAFYKPLDVQAIGGSEFGNNVYTQVKYLVIQNDLEIYFSDKLIYSAKDSEEVAIRNIKESHYRQSLTDSLLMRTNGRLSPRVLKRYGPDDFRIGMLRNKDTLQKRVNNFRPEINCADKQPLYLTSHYDTLLNAFLGNTHMELGAGSIMNPARSAGESQKRQQFLDKLIKIWYGHWGGYWQLYSYPYVSRITFDKDMQYARVYFRFIYEGGEAILKNDNGQWRILSSKLTWIE